MDKISGIIKNSPRVQAVDLKESGGVRPGAPSFGRPEGTSALAKAALSTAALLAPPIEGPAIEAVDPAINWKTKDQKNAIIAAELTNKFFAKPTPALQLAPMPIMSDFKVGTSTLPVSIDDLPMLNTDRFADAGFGSSGRSANFNSLPDMGPALMQPDGYFPRGSFIDRVG